MNATLSSLQAAVSTSEQVPAIKATHPAGQATVGDSPVLHAAIGLAEQIRAASDGDRARPPTSAGHRRGDEGRRRVRHGDAARLGRPGTGPVDAVPRHRGAGHGRRLGRMVRDDRLRRRLHHRLPRSGCRPRDVSRPSGRYRRRRDDDRASESGCRGATASAGAFRSSAAAITANGSGWAASSSKTASPRVDGNGVPETRQCLLRLSQCDILDTWHTTGLRGTGSNDVVVRDVFVEEERTFSFQDPQLVKRPGPLYAFPFMFIAKGAAPALGIARHAIDALIESARPSRPGATRSVSASRLPKCCATTSTCRTRWGAPRRFSPPRAPITSTSWAICGRPCSTAGSRPRGSSRYSPPPIRTSSAFASMWCSSSTRRQAAAAVYQKGPLDRCLRDVLTMNQHVVATPRTYEMAGRLLLGLEPLRWLF